MERMWLGHTYLRIPGHLFFHNLHPLCLPPVVATMLRSGGTTQGEKNQQHDHSRDVAGTVVDWPTEL